VPPAWAQPQQSAASLTAWALLLPLVQMPALALLQLLVLRQAVLV
jgi:hypothetical protein